MLAIVRDLDLSRYPTGNGLQKLVYAIEDQSLLSFVMIWALNFGEPINQASTTKIRKLFRFGPYLPKRWYQLDFRES